MMKMIIGFLASYLEGLAPSRMPPWWAAREAAEAATGFAVTVVVTMEDIMLAMIPACPTRPVALFRGIDRPE